MAMANCAKVKNFRPTRENPARLLVVDDHFLIRKGIQTSLKSIPEIKNCGEAATAAEALEMIPKCKPHIALVDVSLPGPGGVDLIRDMQAWHPEVRILVLSMHSEHIYAERAIRQGARGYVTKSEPFERVVEGIFAVLKGELFVSEELSRTLMHNYFYGTTRNAQQVGVDCLSDRELLVFDSIGRGLSTQEIAKKMFLSPKTVDTYRSNIKRKLGLERNNSLIHAAIYWVEHEGKDVVFGDAASAKAPARRATQKP